MCEDVCYANFQLVSWTQVQTAMRRIKKFLSDGFYLEVTECEWMRPQEKKRYRVKVMGPPKFRAKTKPQSAKV